MNQGRLRWRGIQVNQEELQGRLKSLNESHERFVEAIFRNDPLMAVMAYRNYIIALGLLLEFAMPLTGGSNESVSDS